MKKIITEFYALLQNKYILFAKTQKIRLLIEFYLNDLGF